MTQSITIPTEERQALATALSKRDMTINLCQQLPATTLAEAEIVKHVLQQLLREKDALEERRTSVTKPLNTVVREINSWFKPVSDFYGECEQILKNKLATFTRAQFEEQSRQLEAAKAAHATGDPTAMAAALNTAASTPTKLQGASMREEWIAEVINPALVPPAFLCPDLAKIGAHAKATPDTETPIAIPGVRFVKRAIVAVRRG